MGSKGKKKDKSRSSKSRLGKAGGKTSNEEPKTGVKRRSTKLNKEGVSVKATGKDKEKSKRASSRVITPSKPFKAKKSSTMSGRRAKDKTSRNRADSRVQRRDSREKRRRKSNKKQKLKKGTPTTSSSNKSDKGKPGKMKGRKFRQVKPSDGKTPPQSASKAKAFPAPPRANNMAAIAKLVSKAALAIKSQAVPTKNAVSSEEASSKEESSKPPVVSESHLKIQGDLTLEERKQLSSLFFRSLKFVLFSGRLMGRFPLRYRLSRDGFVEFNASFKQPYMVLFLIVQSIITLLFIIGAFTAFALWIGLPLGPDNLSSTRKSKLSKLKSLPDYKSLLAIDKNKTEEEADKELWEWYLRNRFERYILDRHIIFFVSNWCYLLHTLISGWWVLYKRNTIVTYLNFWGRAIIVLDMDVTRGALKKIMMFSTLYVLLLVFLIFMLFFKFISSVVGGPAVLAIVILRPMMADLLGSWPGPVRVHPALDAMMLLSTFISAFLFISTKFYIIMMIYFGCCLKNAFDKWNIRCYSNTLRAGDTYTREETHIVYQSLYKDHTTLLDLMEGTDDLFSFILESYFGLQALSLCLELYFMIYSATTATQTNIAGQTGAFERKSDWVVASIVYFVHFICMIIILRTFASVGEEAMAGLEILRRKTMVGRVTDSDLLFALSMLHSYTAFKPIGVASYGFFLCNKSLMVAILELVLSYFTLITQFQPKLDFIREGGDPQRKCIQTVINAIESSITSSSLDTACTLQDPQARWIMNRY